MVELRNEDWKQTWHSTTFRNFYEWLDNGTVPQIQNWPATYELKSSGTIPDNAVIMPGTAADFLAGSHLSQELTEMTLSNELINYVVNHHYNYSDIDEDILPHIQSRIQKVAGLEHSSSLVESYERWNWRSRQSRKTVEGVRTYDFFNYDWWLPFWDTEFVHYWMKVPLTKRFNKKLYDSYVEKLYSEVSDGSGPTTRSDKTPRGSKQKLKTAIRDSPAGPYLQPIYNKLFYNNLNESDLRSLRDTHPAGVWAIISEQTLVEEYNCSRNVNSYLARERVGEIDLWEDSVD
jgi:asparagine synthase (glutamine-hydrolysing)